MPDIRDILNEIKWTKNIEKIEIWYLHRGAPNNTKKVTGADIVSVGRSFLETSNATIPYHRITKVLYEGETIFDRWELHLKDKQL
jgi:uncharacterized protein (UPF0248 family)